MPELPEVETIARGIDRRLRGDRILDVWFSSYKEPFKTPPRKQAQGLAGRVILAVHRTGKHIVCELGPAEIDGSGSARVAGASAAKSPKVPEAQWIVHLGMSGRLLISAAGAPMAAHTHARLSLASGQELHFVDPRRFGRLEFRDLNRTKGFGGPGAEPLTIPEAEFAALFKARRLSIKAALLNQQILAGVGNIYADEGLFRAGIRPLRRSEKLTHAELERLRLALREVLEHAIRLGGSSVSDYVDAEGERGFFQLEHNVYRRTGEPCRVCKTPIRRILVTGRGTHFCATCQK
jgi:formamidopyrimidine-DNA glycosylase